VSTAESTLATERPARGRPDGGKRGTEYAELMGRVRKAGLLERRARASAVRIAVNAALYIGGWAAFVAIGDSWWQLATAAYLAVVFTWTGFLAHEAGHKQVFRTRRANDLAGILHGDLAIGLAFNWWCDKHHRHHANPNTEGMDPDIDSSAVVFTPAQGGARRGLRRLIARYQAALFFPLLLLEAASLHVQGIIAIATPGYRQRGREAALFALHVIAYTGGVFLVLPPLKAVAFIAVQQGLLGVYLGCAFAPNHKGMPILSADDDTDFLRRQVLTSRNVRGGRVLDMALGGLNYQIEHHLFPSMPRSALRHARPIVKSFCEEHNISYAETGLFDSYSRVLGHLRDVGRTPAA
jgi:fatty acid desaturase